MQRPVGVVFLFATIACAGPTNPDPVVETPLQLKVGQTASIPGSARLRFDAVRNDSRCPLDAICISAGDAIVAVTLMRGSSNESRELHTMPAQSQLSYSRYVIKLAELQPYPRSDRQARPEDYVATFVVSTQ